MRDQLAALGDDADRVAGDPIELDRPRHVDADVVGFDDVGMIDVDGRERPRAGNAGLIVEDVLSLHDSGQLHADRVGEDFVRRDTGLSRRQNETEAIGLRGDIRRDAGSVVVDAIAAERGRRGIDHADTRAVNVVGIDHAGERGLDVEPARAAVDVVFDDRAGSSRGELNSRKSRRDGILPNRHIGRSGAEEPDAIGGRRNRVALDDGPQCGGHLDTVAQHGIPINCASVVLSRLAPPSSKLPTTAFRAPPLIVTRPTAFTRCSVTSVAAKIVIGPLTNAPGEPTMVTPESFADTSKPASVPSVSSMTSPGSRFSASRIDCTVTVGEAVNTRPLGTNVLASKYTCGALRPGSLQVTNGLPAESTARPSESTTADEATPGERASTANSGTKSVPFQRLSKMPTLVPVRLARASSAQTRCNCPPPVTSRGWAARP